MTGGRCSLIVRVPAPLSVNITLHSLVGAGVSSERDHVTRSSSRDLATEHAQSDGSRSVTSREQGRRRRVPRAAVR